MTKKARLQTKPATPKPTISLSRPSILQRTCACGGVPGLTGECEACSRQRLSRSPGATNPSTLADRSSNDHSTAESHSAIALVGAIVCGKQGGDRIGALGGGRSGECCKYLSPSLTTPDIYSISEISAIATS